jgi:hypothetical protein
MDSAALGAPAGFDSRLRTMSAAAEPQNNPQDVLSAALDYASAGWRVVPIGPKRKFPAMQEWQTHASSNPEEIKNWFTGMYRGHGVGIATGAETRLWVLDVDVNEGKHGDETLADLEAKHGALPPTIEVLTGSGGRHLYFRWPEGREVRNNAGTRLGPGLDVRGEGGQVLAPPTLHPNGTAYAWVIGQGWDEHPMAYPPKWLLDLVCEVPRPEPQLAPTGTELVLPRPNDRPGDRWAASITWKDLLERDGWTFHHTDPSGEEFWTRPGKERREGASATLFYKGADVLKVFTSSIAGLEPEGTYSRFAYLAATRHAGDYYAAAQWCATELARTTLTGTTSPTTSALVPDEVMNPKSFLDRLKEQTYRGIAGLAAIQPVTWLVYPVIQEDSLFQIFAPSSAGKSFAAIDMACCVATGMAWHKHPVRRAGPVVYVVAEGAAGIRDRLSAWAQFHNGGADPVDVYVITLPAMLHRIDEASALAAWCREIGAVMVVIDTYARSTLGLDENKNNEAGLAIDGLDTIRRATGAAVGIVHHTGHTGGRGRGASALYGAMDTVIAIEGDTTQVTMTTSPEKGGKQKNGADDWVTTLAKESIAVGRTDEVGQQVTSLVLVSGRAPRRAAAEDMSENESKVLEALRLVATPDGVTTTVWAGQAAEMGVAVRTFYRSMAALVTAGSVERLGSKKTARYLLKCSLLPSTATALPSSLPSTAILPPPFRGGSSGSNGTTVQLQTHPDVDREDW